MAPYPDTVSYPPLGKVSVIKPSQTQVTFTVLIEWHLSRPEYPFEACLCYSPSSTARHPSTWAQKALETVADPQMVAQTDVHTLTFTGTLSSEELQQGQKGQRVFFTIKYRVNEFAHWLWAETEEGTPRGELIFHVEQSQQLDFADLVTYNSQEWEVARVNEATSAAVFRLESRKSVPDSSDEEALHSLSLGKVRDQCRFMAIVRLAPYWLGPRHGGDYFYVSEDALVCSFLLSNGTILSILALTSPDHSYTVIRSDDDGGVVVAARKDADTDIKFRAFAAASNYLEDSIAAVVNEARKVVNESPYIKDLAHKTEGSRQRDSASYDKWLDGLAFCTWNALGQDLSQDKVLSALKKLEENNIKISTLLIDDNWQTLGQTGYDFDDPFYRGWAEFEANKENFPKGLKGMISEIRDKYPAIKDIGVWHALMGYWGCLALDSAITRRYKTVRCESRLMGNRPCTVTSFAASDLEAMYSDFYTFLSSSGITFVKTDVQHMLSEFRSKKDRQSLIPAYQSAWTQAYTKHFGGKAISCMSETPYTLFGSLLQTHTLPIVFRNSDDFYPEVEASHPWHLWANAHNALFTQHLNVLLDWDMFQTSHSFSAYHAAARCLSGGPILITDVPGEHDISLIDQMTAQAPDGRRIGLRPHSGKTISAFENYANGDMLKIGTKTDTNASLVGLFTISPKQSRILLPITDFYTDPTTSSTSSDPKIKTPSRIIVRSYSTSQLFGPFNLDSPTTSGTITPNDMIYVSVPHRGFEILTASTISTIDRPTGQKFDYAVLGLLDKFTGTAAITHISNSETTTTDSSSLAIDLNLKAVGKLGLYLPDLTEDAAITVATAVTRDDGGKGSVRVKELKALDQQSISLDREKGLVEIDLSEAVGGTKGLEDGGKLGIDVSVIVQLKK